MKIWRGMGRMGHWFRAANFQSKGNGLRKIAILSAKPEQCDCLSGWAYIKEHGFMSATLDYDALVRMLQSAAQEIRDNHETLSKLDSVGGDGDHGSTMVRAMARLEDAVKGCATATVKTLLYDVGWAILGVDGGATGPLLGALFMAMSDA
ncbi:MAG TPA: DAK2 domain-containing protein, partial [Candidatus Hydrogenedentes bacterium]|nr:DAK2 domain-containing protein [Candidatus Hydrogenedentota bacterium]